MRRPPKRFEECTHEQQIARVRAALDCISSLTKEEIKHRFRMESWISRDPQCGTVMCAAGFCGQDPKIRKQGFKMDLTRNGSLIMKTHPMAFFGMDMYENVFVASELVNMYSGRPLEVHKAVIKATKRVLSRLEKSAKLRKSAKKADA